MGRQKRLSLAQATQLANEAVTIALDATGVTKKPSRGRPRKENNTNLTANPPINCKKSYAIVVVGNKTRQPVLLNSKATQQNEQHHTYKHKNDQLDLIKTFELMRKEIDELKEQIKQLKYDRTSPSIKQNLRTVNNAVTDVKERERRSKNVVIRGIQPIQGDSPEHDKETARAFLKAVCPNVEPEKVIQLHQSKPSKDKSKSTSTPSILVVLKDVESQKRVLQAARHHDNEQFQGVFAHEDRTQAQQLQFAECSKQAKSRNDKLRADGLLDQPFRFVVRGDRVRCIDKIQFCELKKSCYVSEQQLKQHIDNIGRVNKAIGDGSINTGRTSVLPATITATQEEAPNNQA